MTTMLSPSLRLGHPVAPRRLSAPLARVAAIAGLLGGPAAGQAPAPPAAPPAAAAPAASDPAAGDPAAAAAAKPNQPPSERLKLSTSDGVALAAWYYPAVLPEPESDDGKNAPPTPTPAIAILLHDLGGSHKSVEPLAFELQALGIAVVAPDLRGHGATVVPESRGEADADGRSLKKADFVSMAATGGGRVRDQETIYGDVEAVRNWIKQHAADGEFDMSKLVVVGSGLGAAVAAQWAVADAAWPDLASGRQGNDVRGLVLVSPAWTIRGYTISPVLATEPIRRTVPILVIGGTADGDAVKLYDQLKRQRPDGWSEKRAGQAAVAMAPKLTGGTLPSLYLRQLDSALSGDRLAAAVPKDRRQSHPAAIIERFIAAVTTAER